MTLTRILYVDHAPEMGGAERSLLYLMKALDRSRFEPVLACPPDSPLATEAAAAGILVAPLPLPQVKRAPWSAAPAYLAGVWRLAAFHTSTFVDRVTTDFESGVHQANALGALNVCSVTIGPGCVICQRARIEPSVLMIIIMRL